MDAKAAVCERKVRIGLDRPPAGLHRLGVAARPGSARRQEPWPGSFDLVWPEGALDHIGITNALGVCRGLLHPGGCLAFTDAVWRQEDPPPPKPPRSLAVVDRIAEGLLADCE